MKSKRVYFEDVGICWRFLWDEKEYGCACRLIRLKAFTQSVDDIPENLVVTSGIFKVNIINMALKLGIKLSDTERAKGHRAVKPGGCEMEGCGTEMA